MLTDVTIEGLRGVGRVELRFAPEQRVYTLFGANGVGKTKCLEALYQWLMFSNKDYRRVCGNGYFRDSLFVMARMHDVPHGVTFEIPRGGGFPINESVALHNFPVVFLGAARRTSLADKSVRPASSDITNISDNLTFSLNGENALPVSTLGTFEGRRDAYFVGVMETLISCDLGSLGMTGDVRGWFIARAQSVNPYQESRDNRKVEIDAVLSMLHEIEPLIDPDPEESLRIGGDGKVFLKVDGQKRELGELSSGFAALLKMVQAIVAGYAAFTNEVQLQRVRGIVFIDEIDAHLHVEWQVKIISCLKSLFPNTTFYIATHSPLVLKQLKEKEAYLLKRDDDGVVRSRTISHPNRRLFVDVLEDGLGVKLNALDDDDQSDLKQRMLSLLQAQEKGTA